MCDPVHSRFFACIVTASMLVFAGFACVARGSTVDVIDEVQVTGERPGPAMWRVSKADHDLWILATLSPLTKKMTWRSGIVEARIASSQVVLSPPTVKVDIGFFKAVGLIPAALHARHSPDGKSLEQKLPHELYIRWLALRVKYLGQSDEKLRPAVAAFDLYDHALDAADLADRDSDIWGSVKRAADGHHVAIEAVEIKASIKDPKETLRELAQIPDELEITCLEKTMERIETGLPIMVRRANLWALGDIQGLRANPLGGAHDDCRQVFLATSQMKSQLQQIEKSVNDAWLQAAGYALARNPTSFAVVAIDDLLGPEGYLQELEAKGYDVVEPQSMNSQ